MNRFERHQRLTGFLFFVAVSLLGLILFELVLRFTGLGDALIDDPRPLKPARHLIIREYIPDTVFRFTPPPIRRSSGDNSQAEYVIATDEHGFIKPGRIHPNPDITIAFLGGSTTECLFVDAEARFPALIGRMLEQETGLKINTINAARSGNNTQLLQLIMQAKILPQKPDIVVMMENANDLGVLSNFGTYWNDSTDFALVRETKRGVSEGFRMLRDATIGYSYRVIREAVRNLKALTGRALGANAAQAATPAATGSTKVENWARQYEASLSQFVSTAQAWGIRPILMTQVSLGASERRRDVALEGNYLADDYLRRRGFDARSFDDTHSYFNQIARDTASRLQAGVIDLAGAGKWDAKLLYDGLHFSDPGSRRVAEIATPVLAAEIKRLRRSAAVSEN